MFGLPFCLSLEAGVNLAECTWRIKISYDKCVLVWRLCNIYREDLLVRFLWHCVRAFIKLHVKSTVLPLARVIVGDFLRVAWLMATNSSFLIHHFHAIHCFYDGSGHLVLFFVFCSWMNITNRNYTAVVMAKGRSLPLPSFTDQPNVFAWKTWMYYWPTVKPRLSGLGGIIESPDNRIRIQPKALH